MPLNQPGELVVGQSLAHYQILEALGAGGMGEVYRARDTRLGRDVAIKVLPAAVALEPERLARFEREAQLLAALNHPNIAGIYGLEQSNGLSFLVLEFIPGEELKGPLRVEEALAVSRQLAEGLEAAHDKGIIHRDLKPSNVKVTPDGKVKILDFGLAKAFADDRQPSYPDRSPTLPSGATRAGVILGTAAYMSPEQARGKTVDKRADIWAFGCVLYELLSGRQAFGGETVSDSLAATLKNEPNWNVLPETTPPNIRRLLERCLEKDPRLRLRDIGEARIAMTEKPLTAEPRTGRAPRWQRVIPWVLAAVALAVAVWSLVQAPKPQPRPPVRFAVELQPFPSYFSVALARDGASLAWVGTNQIYLRRIDEVESRPIPGTEGGWGPFFSPDGKWLGFVASDKVKKVLLTGGDPVTICDTPRLPLDGAWGDDDVIIFGREGSGLMRVPSSGGTPQPLSRLDHQKDEFSHRHPEILPGGRDVLFSIMSVSGDSQIAVLNLGSGERRVLFEGGPVCDYTPTGHLVYEREGALVAAPFDPDQLRLTASPVRVLEGVSGFRGIREHAISDSGVLAFVPGGRGGRDRTLVWVDRQGATQPVAAPPRQYSQIRLSPDGQRVALDIRSPNWVLTDIWVYHLSRGTLSPLTFQSRNRYPVWSPDGKRIAFGTAGPGQPGISSVPADGSAPAESLLTGERGDAPTSWSPNGKELAFQRSDLDGKFSTWVIPLIPKDQGQPKPRPFHEPSFNISDSEFSPDGRWIAYRSYESGRAEVYVQTLSGAASGPAGKWLVSTEGGTHPRWARNGRELFYRNYDKLMAVEIQPGPVFHAGKPRLLFEGRYDFGYDVDPDGKRFLMIKGSESATAPQLHVVLEWFDELRRRVAQNSRQ